MMDKNLVRVSVSHVSGSCTKTKRRQSGLWRHLTFQSFIHRLLHRALMLLRACHKARSVILPDFLVPRLLNCKVASSSASSIIHEVKDGSHYARKKLAALPKDRRAPRDLCKNITERINALHSGVSISVPDENINIFNTTASKLRYALKGGDILGAYQHWCSLQEKGLLHILGPIHMEGYSSFITNLSPLNNPDTHWNKSEKGAVEKIALGAAKVGKATGALSTCMLYNLTNKDPDAALELYRRYMEELSDLSQKGEDLENSLSSMDAEQDTPDGLGLSSTGNPVGYSPGRSTVLL